MLNLEAKQILTEKREFWKYVLNRCISAMVFRAFQNVMSVFHALGTSAFFYIIICTFFNIRIMLNGFYKTFSFFKINNVYYTLFTTTRSHCLKKSSSSSLCITKWRTLYVDDFSFTFYPKEYLTWLVSCEQFLQFQVVLMCHAVWLVDNTRCVLVMLFGVIIHT